MGDRQRFGFDSSLLEPRENFSDGLPVAGYDRIFRTVQRRNRNLIDVRRDGGGRLFHDRRIPPPSFRSLATPA